MAAKPQVNMQGVRKKKINVMGIMSHIDSRDSVAKNPPATNVTMQDL
jgi:hypothetical protein